MSARTHEGTRVVAALAAPLAIAWLAAASAQAAGETSATCVHEFTATITPGFSMTPSSGTQTTNGETGTMLCTGTVDGHRVTGEGTVGFHMDYSGGSCAGENSSGGTVRVTLPTTAGVEHFVGTLTVSRTLLAVRADVQFDGMRYGGTGVALPRQGACPLLTLRQALLVFAGTLSDT